MKITSTFVIEHRSHTGMMMANHPASNKAMIVPGASSCCIGSCCCSCGMIANNSSRSC